MLRALRVKYKRDENSKNPKEMLEIKNTITEIKNVCDGLISILDMAEEKVSELLLKISQ